MSGTQPLRIQVEINGVWTDVDTFTPRPVKISRGMDAGGSWPAVSRIEAELDNDDLSLDPSRPESPLYGVASRGARVRLRMNGTERLRTEAASWRPSRTLDHRPGEQRGRSATDLVAEGLLGRIGTWTEVLRSPMYRTNSGRTTSIGHWPLEDGREATSLSNSLAGGAAARYSGGISLAEEESPGGAQQAVRIAADSTMSGRFAPASTTAGWQLAFSVKAPALPPSGTYVDLFSWTTSNGYTWRWLANNIAFRWIVTASDGSTVWDTAFSYGSARPLNWLTARMKVSVSGGTVTAEPAWYEEGDLAEVGGTDTFSGSAGALTSWTQSGNATTDGWWFSHVLGVTGTSDSLIGATVKPVLNGYRGETAGARYLRLTAELGITRYITGTSADTQPMGAQRADTLINLLREIVDTDDCMISDTRLDIALSLRTRRSMIAQTSKLDLTFGVDVAAYEKAIDDLLTANIITVSNRDGADLTVSQATGPMSVQVPPNGVGEARKSVDVNVSDEVEQLPQLGGWRLAKGTLSRPRYGSVTVDLVANPELTASCESVGLGDLITIAAIEPYLVKLLVVGVTETCAGPLRSFEFKTEPYEPYDAGRYDNSAFRYDSRTTTLKTARDTTQTALTFRTTDAAEVWSTAGVPYDVLIAGERVTVTSMGAASLVSGAYDQAATVTRSVNGVTKSLAAGEEIHVATPGRWAL